MTYLSKIKTLSEIKGIVDVLKSEGKVVVTNNGSYDIFHAGHVSSLYDAKALGDVLVVGVNSDFSVKKNRGFGRPIISEGMRLKVVAGLGCVDYVFLFNETTPCDFLEVLKPNIHTNGKEYGKNCVESEVVNKYGGKVHILPIREDVRSTKIINKIKSLNIKDN